jgi:hypothetical protein
MLPVYAALSYRYTSILLYTCARTTICVCARILLALWACLGQSTRNPYSSMDEALSY